MKIKSAVFFKSCVSRDGLPKGRRPEIAFVGRSNVGKSSLINTLLNRKGLAKTSSRPGKTRALNYYLINDSFFFVDLPGYGYSEVSMAQKQKWAVLIEDFLKNRKQLVLVVQLIDVRHRPTSDDCMMIDWFRYYRTPVVIAATKSDKLSRSRLTESISAIKQMFEPEEFMVIPFSSATGLGKDQLWDVIRSAIRQNNLTFGRFNV